MANPYEQLPSSAFWRSAVATASPFDLKDLYRKKFAILPTHKIATAGSCFAQRLSRALRRHGYPVLDVEPPPPSLPAEQHSKYGYSIYSARYGNIYTLPQLLQLAKEAQGTFEPQDIAWTKDGRFFDALRPAVEPDGLETEAELRLARKHHVERVGHLFRSMDLLVFTLGLTEAWRHKRSGTIYPTAPGVFAGAFDDETYEFVNFDCGDYDRAFHEFLEVLRSLRGRAPMPNILLTVSPVPITATASGTHVLQAMTYTKSVLRAFAGAAARRYEFVDYFPGYEIIMNLAARGVFYESNLRTIREEGVEVVMRTFFDSHPPARDQAPETSTKTIPTSSKEKTPALSEEERIVAEAMAGSEQCEEAMLEAFGR